LIRVVVVDDFQPWQEFVVSVLKTDAAFSVVGVALDGLEAVRLCRELEPELIIMDINLPNCSGIAAAEEIRRFLPKVEVVFFSRDLFREVIQAALELGARGFVAKNDGHDLLHAIHRVVNGKQYLSQEVLRHFHGSADKDE